jgi:hypothetical protein
MNNPPLYSDGNRLCTIVCSQLSYNMLDVHLDGFFGDKKLLGDFAVSIPASDGSEDFDFPLRQRFIPEMIGELRGEFGWNAFFSSVHLPDGLDEFTRQHIFQQVASSAGFQGSLDFNITLEGRQHHDAGIGKFRSDRNERIDAAHIREPEVHQGHVRSVLSIFLDSFATAGRLGDQRHVGLIFDDCSNPSTHQRVIIHAN